MGVRVKAQRWLQWPRVSVALKGSAGQKVTVAKRLLWPKVVSVAKRGFIKKVYFVKLVTEAKGCDQLGSGTNEIFLTRKG